MKYTFKAPMMKEWTVTDDRIIFKNKELLLSDITKIEHEDTSEGKWTYGVVQVFHNKGGLGFYTFSYPHSQRDDAFKVVEYIFGIVGGEEKAKEIAIQKLNRDRGFIKKCNICGHIFCYTYDDINKNKSKTSGALLNAVGEIAGALSGNYAAGAVMGGRAENQLDRIIDYNKCPHCGSNDLIDATEEELEQFKNKNSGTAPFSAADELKKYKDLLDNGVITQEEFEAKKKQLLGL